MLALFSRQSSKLSSLRLTSLAIACGRHQNDSIHYFVGSGSRAASSRVNAMPSITLPRRRNNGGVGGEVSENVPLIEVQIPPSVKISQPRRRKGSGLQARDVEVRVDQEVPTVTGNSGQNGEAFQTPASGAGAQTDVPAPPAKKARRSKKQIKEDATAAMSMDGSKGEAAAAVADSSSAPQPARKRRRAAQKAAIIEDDQADLDDSKSVVSATSQADGDADGSVELDSDGEPVKRNKLGRKIGKRQKKPKEPIVYVIPDVPSRDFRLEGPPEKREERKDGFKGRLGYACLNTVLRNRDPPVFCSRNVRIKTIEEKGLDWVKDLGRQNVKDIIPLLQFNAANNIHMMRLSSEIFPFAGHDKYGYDISYAAKELAEAGEVARRLGQRLTMHPGQFCVLGTPRESVLEASIRELEVHAKVLDLMGVGPDGVMILHGGGTYGDREEALKRIRHTIEHRLPDFVRRRLVLENDEMSYSAEELLPLCESLDPPVPLIFDFHHDLLRPSSLSPAEIIQRAQALFARRGITPKYHLSEPRPGARTLMERRAHSDRCAELPADLPVDADLMLECKDKEQGVLEMYRIYNLYPVIHDNLRPPADDLTTSTGGRKSKLDGSGGVGASVSGGGSSLSPAKQAEQTMIERVIEKAKAAAAKKGVKYTGPLSQKDREIARGPIMSAAEVREDMARKAEQTRRELREGKERRATPSMATEDGGAIKEEPEPDAY